MAKSNKRLVPMLIVLLVLAVAGGAFYAYERVEKAKMDAMFEASKKPVSTIADPPPVERSKPSAIRSYEALAEPPLTLAALQFLPAQADVALGIPPLATLLDKGVPLAQDLAGPRLNIQAEINSIAQGIALEMGMPEEENDLAEILTTLGIDVHSGAAVFLTAAKSLEGALADLEANKKPRFFETPGSSLTIALPVLDGTQAEENILKFLGNLLANIEVTEEEVAGLTLRQYEDHAAYFVTPKMFVISTDLEILKTAAERAADPAVFQYGTVDCPPDYQDEGVALVFMNRMESLMNLLDKEIEELDPLSRSLLSIQADHSQAMFEDSIDEEPAILSWNLTDAAFELKTKISALAYPVMELVQGDGVVMKWAQRLPENTQAFLSLNLNDALKRQITQDYVPAIPEETLKKSKASKAMNYLPNIMQLLGGEITLGLTGLDPLDVPSLFLILALENPNAAQMFLPLAPQQDSGEPYKDIQIKQLTVPTPFPLYFALVDSALILTNSDEGLQGLIDLATENASSGFFESLDPPLNGEQLTYQSFYFDPRLYTEAIDPIASLFGMTLPETVVDIASTVSEHLESLRINIFKDGEWSTSSICLTRKAALEEVASDAETAEEATEEVEEETEEQPEEE